MFIYLDLRSISGCFTVGHYAPHGAFIPESDHGEAEKAAERCHYLNGGREHERDPVCQALNEGDGAYRP